MGEEAQGGMEKHEDYKFELVSDTVMDDKAIVTYKTPDGGEEDINLVKVDGDWKVDFKK